jgi:hypothetical protein
MKIKKLVQELKSSLEKNIKYNTVETNDHLNGIVSELLNVLDTEKEVKLLNLLIKPENDIVSKHLRENILMVS